MRIAAVFSHPVQYNAPLFRELSRTPGVDLTVYFLSRQGLEVSFDPNFGQAFKWDLPLLDGYCHKFIPNQRTGHAVNGFLRLINFGIWAELRRGRFDAVLVHGYEHLAKWFAFGGAVMAGSRLVFRGESHLNEPRGVLRRAAKRILLGSLFRLCSGVTFLGTLNREYYLHYGVPAERLHFAPYSVDNAFFTAAADAARNRRAELRSTLGIDDRAPLIVSVGKLISVKQPMLLLQAFSVLRRTTKCHLVFVGDGALRSDIEEEVRSAAIPDVHITGFINQSRIPEMYACADILVLPSRHEPWGLAINEAMACGLPIIASDRVGCSRDLVQENANGYVFRHDSPAHLTECLVRLVESPERIAEFGRRSREIVEGWSVRQTAGGIISACLPNRAVS